MARMSSHGDDLGRRERILRGDWKRTERSCGSTVRASARIICEGEGLCICLLSSYYFFVSCFLICSTWKWFRASIGTHLASG